MNVRQLSAVLVVGAAVVLFGLRNQVELAPLEFASQIELPELPRQLAPEPRFDQVSVHLFDSMSLVDATVESIGPDTVVLRQPGAVALVDGRVLAANPGAVRPLLERLHWHDLPLSVANDGSTRERTLAAVPTASLAWRAQLRALLVATALRDALQENLAAALGAFAITIVLCAGLAVRRLRSDAVPEQEVPVDEVWPEEVAEATFERPAPIPIPLETARPTRRLGSVRVVLVADHQALEAARIAIGEEHIVGHNRDAFAFAHGWILAVREGSIFELTSELGWDTQPMRVLRPGDGLPNGNAWAPSGSVQPGGALDVVEALQLCGPIAHSGGGASQLGVALSA